MPEWRPARRKKREKRKKCNQIILLNGKISSSRADYLSKFSSLEHWLSSTLARHFRSPSTSLVQSQCIILYILFFSIFQHTMSIYSLLSPPNLCFSLSLDSLYIFLPSQGPSSPRGESFEGRQRRRKKKGNQNVSEQKPTHNIAYLLYHVNIIAIREANIVSCVELSPFLIPFFLLIMSLAACI